MSESEDFMKKANSKLISSIKLYEIGQYADSVSLAYYAMSLQQQLY